MGYSTTAISVKRAIRLARFGCITSWDEGLPRRVVPSQIVRAELGDNDHLYYHNPHSHYGYRGRGDNELMQDVDLNKSCKRR